MTEKSRIPGLSLWGKAEAISKNTRHALESKFVYTLYATRYTLIFRFPYRLGGTPLGTHSASLAISLVNNSQIVFYVTGIKRTDFNTYLAGYTRPFADKTGFLPPIQRRANYSVVNLLI